MVRLFLIMLGFIAVLSALGLTINVLIHLLDGVETSKLVDELAIFFDDLLRKFLRPKGFLIQCVLPGGDKGTIPHYQMVRHLASSND